jgi:hypothetical protein
MKQFINIILITLLLYIKGKNYYRLQNPSYTDNKRLNFLKADLIYSKKDFDIDEYNIPKIKNKNFDIIRELSAEFRLECDDIFHLKITDKHNTRWEPPYLIDQSYLRSVETCESTKTLSDYGFEFTNTKDEFYFSLTNPKTKEIYYTWKNGKLIFSDNLIVFDGSLTSNDIYGFGERAHDFNSMMVFIQHGQTIPSMYLILRTVVMLYMASSPLAYIGQREIRL